MNRELKISFNKKLTFIKQSNGTKQLQNSLNLPTNKKLNHLIIMKKYYRHQQKYTLYRCTYN